ASFEAICRRTIAILGKNSPSYAEVRVPYELLKKKLEMVFVKGNIAIQIPENFILKAFDSFTARIESKDLARKTAIPSHGQLNHFDPRMLLKITPDDFWRLVG